MELISTVTVDAPVGRTWAAVTDLPQLASYLPHAEAALPGSARRVPHDGSGDHDRTTVAWHSALRIEGVTARIVERDDDAHRVVLCVEGREGHAQGDVSATIRVALRPQGAGTQIAVETDLALRGEVARIGRGVVAGAVAKVVAQGAQRLEAELRAAAAAVAQPAAAAAGPVAARPAAARPAAARPAAARPAAARPAAARPADASPADAGTATSSTGAPGSVAAPVAAPRGPAAVDSPDPARGGAGLRRAAPVIGALVALLLGWRFARRAVTASRGPA